MVAGGVGSQWFTFYQWYNIHWADWNYLEGSRIIEFALTILNAIVRFFSWCISYDYQLTDEQGKLVGVDASNLLIANSGNDLPVRT